jgi:threonine 3-dehydrogenase
MKALYKPAAGPGFELVDRPEPVPGVDEVKIRVLRTGICGTDLHIESWDAWAAGAVDAPLIPGHEFCGEVVEVGTGVRDVAVGDLVSGEGHIVCGTCRNCRAGRRHLCIRTSSVGVNRDGAFAEYVVLPESNVWVHHQTVEPDLGAIFDPFGNAVHTALSFPLVGEDVLITGAGPIGLIAAEVCRHVGARFVVITDVSPYRLELARSMGVDLALDVSLESVASAQQRLGMVEGFDVALEMSGHPSALPEIIANLNHGGRIAMLGLPAQPIEIDWSKVVTHMITIKGIYGREMFETWYAMSAMLRSGLDISAVITHRFPATQWADAFATARGGQCGKVVMDWTVF